MPVLSIVADPQHPSTLYLGSDIGVFVSVDGGATWARDDNPFANVVTEQLVLDRSAGQTALIAFTHGRGVWKTILPGSAESCQYAASSDSFTFPAAGGSARVTVKTGDRCGWAAVASSRQIALSSPAGTAGTTSFTLTAMPNGGPEPLTAYVQVQDKSIRVTQDAARAASGNDDRSSPFSFGELPAVVTQNTSLATESKSDPIHSCTRSADSKTVWFSLTANEAGRMHLDFYHLRPNGGSEATVISTYRVRGDSVGPESNCFTSPYLTYGQWYLTYWPVNAGDTYLVEVSATAFGAPPGTTAGGGNLVMVASISK